MNEDKTAETNGRPFEERVFARFDAIDARFDKLEDRIEKIEAGQYDTKPIWEQALFAIAETNKAMEAGFEKLRKEMEDALHGVARKIDVLNQNILEVRAEQRWVESRLEKLES